MSSTIEARLATRPTRYTSLPPMRCASVAPKSEVATARITWGTNIAPYWEFERWYASEAIKMVLAAGKVTRVMPCTSAAAFTVRFSSVVAMCTRSSGQPAPEMLSHSDGIGDGGERRVDRADAGEEAGIHYIEIIELMGLAVGIQHRGFGVAPEATRTCLVAATGDRYLVLHIEVARDQVVRVHTQMWQHGFQLVVELLACHLIIGRVAEGDPPCLIDGYSVLWTGQVLGGEPEVYRVSGHVVQGPVRSEPGHQRFLSAVHGSAGFARHLDVAHGIVEAFHPKVEIVEAKRLFEGGGICFGGDCQDRAA